MAPAISAAAATATATASSARARKNNSSRSPLRRDLPSPAATSTTRPPLFPSEKDNNATVPKRPRGKEITSRYLSSSSFAKGGSFSSSTASSSSKAGSFTSSSSSSSTSTSTASSSSSATPSSARRFPSPLRPSTPPALSRASAPKRSKSVDRTRPAPTPRVAELSSAARALCTSATTTRSLSVSFQGESFSYQTTKARPLSPSPGARKPTPTPERRKTFTPAATTPRSSVDGLENSRPFDKRHRWPAARLQQSNPLTRSLEYCSIGKKDSILEAVRSLRQSMVLDGGMRRASFDGGDFHLSSDTDSLSSGSNSGTHESGVLPLRGQATPRGISIPARFLQEKSDRSQRLPEPGTPSPSPCSKNVASSKLAKIKKSLMNVSLLSPFTSSSSPHGFPRPSSPSKLAAHSLRGSPSPQSMRNGSTASSSTLAQPGNAPSVLNFKAEVRRGKNGESRIEDAHQLRLFYNRHLQWRWVNAQASDASLSLNLTAEKYLYNAWIATAKMHESVIIEKLKLQAKRQHLKLGSILKGQIGRLEEWALIGRDHTSFLQEAIKALKASTICIPVVDGAKANFEETRNAVGSAVDVMQAIATTICSMLSTIERRVSMMGELVQLTTQELTLIHQCRDLLSTLAATHVKQCSVLGYMAQRSSKLSLIQL